MQGESQRPSETPCPKCGKLENWEVDYTGTLWCTDCSVEIETIEGLVEKDISEEELALRQQSQFLLERNTDLSLQMAKMVMLLLEYEQRLTKLERDKT